ncbi:hypothetical protein P7C70_g3794, partial [Phenoliferia sp. Uapishka_3]
MAKLEPPVKRRPPVTASCTMALPTHTAAAVLHRYDQSPHIGPNKTPEDHDTTQGPPAQPPTPIQSLGTFTTRMVNTTTATTSTLTTEDEAVQLHTMNRTEWGLQTGLHGNRAYISMDKLISGKEIGKFNLIVFVLDHAKPHQIMKKGKPTGDWAVAIRFTDPTSLGLNGHLGGHLLGNRAQEVPLVRRGFVLLLQGINRGKLELDNSNITGYKGFSFAIFPSDALLTGTVTPVTNARSPEAKYGQDEIAYACDLARYWRDHEVDIPQSHERSDPAVEATKERLPSNSSGKAESGRRQMVMVKKGECITSLMRHQEGFVPFPLPIGFYIRKVQSQNN